MQVEHKTEKGTLLFVKVPDYAYNFTNDMQPNQLDFYVDTPFKQSKLTFGECVILPKGNWQLIGLTSEITEEQAKMIGLASVSNFRKEIEKLQVYEVNPLDKPNRYLACKLHPLECTGDEINRCRKYEEAQSRTGKWIVLFKPND